MMKSLVVAVASSILLMGCEGKRSLDNPENLDNMPVQDERVEDTTGLHKTGTESDSAGTTGTSESTTGTNQM